MTYYRSCISNLKNYSFEEGVFELFGAAAEIHTFDRNQGRDIPDFVNFHHNKIVGERPDGTFDSSDSGISITAIREEVGHTGKPIDIFKIDIEGAEYKVLKTYVGPGCPLNANMILMETHRDSLHHYNELFTNLRDNCKMELYMKEPNLLARGVLVGWFDICCR